MSAAMRRALLVSLVACGHPSSAPSPSPDAPTEPTGPIAAHVTDYDFTFDLDSRAAHATVTAVVDTAGDCFTLPLRATPDTTTAKVDGAAATATVDDSAHTVTLCGAGDDAGATMTLDLDEHGRARRCSRRARSATPSTNRRRRQPVLLPRQLGVRLRSVRAVRQPPRPVRDLSLHVTHPAGVTVRCPGTITEDSDDRDRVRLHVRRRPDATRRSASPRRSRGWTRPTRACGAASTSRSTTARTTGIAARDRHRVERRLRRPSWSRRSGPFPFGSELRVLTAPTYWNGFEHPGNIVLDDSLDAPAHRLHGQPSSTRSTTRWRTCGPATRRRSPTPTTSRGRSRWPSTSPYVYEDMHGRRDLARHRRRRGRRWRRRHVLPGARRQAAADRLLRRRLRRRAR